MSYARLLEQARTLPEFIKKNGYLGIQITEDHADTPEIVTCTSVLVTQSKRLTRDHARRPIQPIQKTATSTIFWTCFRSDLANDLHRYLKLLARITLITEYFKKGKWVLSPEGKIGIKITQDQVEYAGRILKGSKERYHLESLPNQVFIFWTNHSIGSSSLRRVQSLARRLDGGLERPKKTKVPPKNYYKIAKAYRLYD